MITLAERKSRFGEITILQGKQAGSVVYCQGGFFQSEADCNGVSLVSYIHAIYGLLQQGNSRKILMIGCGGGTLATMLCKQGCEVTVIDADAQAFLLARKYFGLPSSAVCRVADGFEYLQSDTSLYDAVVLDAFVGDQIPRHLRSCVFFQLVRKHLTQDGCILANVHVRDDLDKSSDRLATLMTSVWQNVRILDTSGSTNRNAIVMAGSISHLRNPAMLVAPRTRADEVDAELRAMNFRSWCDDWRGS
jgi:spermidine synthase